MNLLCLFSNDCVLLHNLTLSAAESYISSSCFLRLVNERGVAISSLYQLIATLVLLLKYQNFAISQIIFLVSNDTSIVKLLIPFWKVQGEPVSCPNC